MKKALSTILVLTLMALCIVSCDNNTSTTSLKSIEVTTKPTKLTYTVGESLNTADMVVTATYTNGTSKVVTGFTVDTTVLSTVGTKTVTVSFTQNGVTKTASFDVTVKYPPFTVTFVKNDASAKNLDFESMTVDYGSTYKTLPEIEKDNYTFLGWYDAPSGGNKVTKDTTVTKASNHYLYAQWIENGKFKVVFAIKDDDKNTTTGNLPDEIEGYLTQNIIVPGNIGKDGTDGLVKIGYTFTGWAPKDESYDSGAFITASKERVITLYAQWKANEYTITYKDEGDVACTATTNTSPTKHTYDTETTLVSPTKTGYAFDGWFESSDCSGTAVTTIGATTTTADITLYAKWTAITTFNLNGKYVGGTPVVAGTTDNIKASNDAFNLPAVVYYSSTNQTKGFAVTKWNTKDDGTGTDYVAGASYTPSAGQTLYVKEGHSWVQLWFEDKDSDGINDAPKWAEFNVGSTISNYASANQTSNGATAFNNPLYCTANVGGLYGWGGKINIRTDSSTAPTAPTDQYTGTDYDTNGNLKSENDTATLLWGSNWKMPKKADLDGLLDTSKCTAELVETGYGNLKGLKVTGNTTGYTSNSIFFPAAGFYFSNLDCQGVEGFYWSSTPNNTDTAYRLNFLSSGKYMYFIERNLGYTVRAILAE